MGVYEIPLENFHKFETKIERLANKAAKLGCPTIAWRELGRSNKEYEPGQFVRVVKVEVLGLAPIIEGWRFVAKLEPGPVEGENLVYSFADDGYLPVEYRTVGMDCDHCGQKRRRKAVCVVEHTEAGVFKQVGSTCLKDFTGHDSPDGIASAAECILELDGLREDFEYDRDMVLGPDLVALDKYLAWVVKDVREFGWTGRRDGSLALPTADSAMMRMFDARKNDERLDQGELDEARAALAWVQEGWGQLPVEELGDYAWNLVQATRGDTCPFRHIGIVASLIPTYRRGVERKREAEASPSEWQGEVKKRQVWEGLTVTRIIPNEGQWGMTYITKLVDGAGNVFTWFASKRLEEGVMYQGRGTVKVHDEYRGIKQTVLTRCKFEEVS